jgi:hypothetical protein
MAIVDRPPTWWPRVIWINIPQTTTVLAMGFLIGNLALLPMLAEVGRQVPEYFRAEVKDVVSLFKDGMLLILGFYFAKVVNAGGAAQDRLNEKIVDKLPPPTGEAAETAALTDGGKRD